MDAYEQTVSLNKNFDALCKDLEDIEGLMLTQLDELAVSIPEVYSGYASIVRQIAGATIDLFKPGKRNADKIALVAEIGGRSIKAFGEYKAAKKHNELLRKYMRVKAEIANNNLSRIRFALPKATQNCQKSAKIFNKCCELNYPLDQLTSDNLKTIASFQEKALNIHRTNLYMFELCKYLINEYEAWLDNKQMSEYDMPDYYLINSILAEKMFGENLLAAYSEAADQTSTITGSQIMLLNDYSLSLKALGNNLCNVNIEEAHPLVGQLMNICGAHNNYMDWVKEYKDQINSSASSAVYLLGAIAVIAIICIVMFYFDCSTTIKLLTVMTAIGTTAKICVRGARKVQIAEVQKCIDMANAIDSTIEAKCGKVERPDFDFEERNELKAAISGFLQ